MIRPILQSRFTNHPSRIAVLLVLLAGARAQAQPAGPLSVLDVPYLTQSESLCGGAAAAMVLRYWGERGIDAETFAPLVDRRLAGIRTTVLVGELQRRGWNVTAVGGTSELIAGEIDSGRPVIALIEDRPRVFHYVVIVAITPRGIVLHDPARAPYRVMARDEFERRWRAADRWMAIVRPMDDRVPPPRDAFLRASPQQDDAGTTPAADATQIASAPSEATRLEATRSTTRATCEALVQEGIASAQADDLASAERSLARALSCPGVDAVRELAGVRFLQRRWADAASLATTVTREAPADDYSWKLLGTSLFLENATPASPGSICCASMAWFTPVNGRWSRSWV